MLLSSCQDRLKAINLNKTILKHPLRSFQKILSTFLSSNHIIHLLSGKRFFEKGDKMEILVELFNDTLNEIGVILALIPEGVWKFLTFTAAAAAAVGAFLSARAVRLTSRGQLFSQLLAQYSSDEMNLALMKMGLFDSLRRKDKEEFFAKVKTTVSNRMDEKSVKAIDPEGVNACRRRVSHYFQTILRLYENKQIIDKDFLQHICSFSGFELLYSVVEHFEKEIGKEKGGYNRDMFTRLLYLSGRHDIRELEKLRPLKESTE